MLIRPDGVNNLDVAVNRLREGAQEAILCELSKNGFSDVAVFHGGTCLRILHGLDRFSEDLDFSLIERDYGFDLESQDIRNRLITYEEEHIDEAMEQDLNPEERLRKAEEEYAKDRKARAEKLEKERR